MSANAIECANIVKYFYDFWKRPRVKALDGVNLQVPEGRIFALLGPNGAGKSTLLKLMLGHLFPSEGQIRVMGKDPRDIEIRRRLGYLPEYSYLYPQLTPRQTFHFFGKLQEMSPTVIEQRSRQLLDMLGLGHVIDRPVGEFSHGMNRRLGLALALLHDPDLILLDEPTAGLDPLGCHEIKELLRTLAARGKTILITSHLLADVEQVAHEVAIMYAGRVQSCGPLQELLANRRLWKIIMTAPPEELKRKILDEIKRIWPDHAIEEGPAEFGLEDYFLEVVRQASTLRESSGARESRGVAEFLREGLASPPAATEGSAVQPPQESGQEVVQEEPEAGIRAEDRQKLQSASTVSAGSQSQTQPEETVTGAADAKPDVAGKDMPRSPLEAKPSAPPAEVDGAKESEAESAVNTDLIDRLTKK